MPLQQRTVGRSLGAEDFPLMSPNISAPRCEAMSVSELNIISARGEPAARYFMSGRHDGELSTPLE
jgi:hypothetical protein